MTDMLSQSSDVGIKPLGRRPRASSNSSNESSVRSPSSDNSAEKRTKMNLVVRSSFLDVEEEAEVDEALNRSLSDSGKSYPSSASSSNSNGWGSDKCASANAAAQVFVNRNLPSVGSAKHFEGSCFPCSFFQKNRCLEGRNCYHCHYDHDRKSRPNKKTRQRLMKDRTERNPNERNPMRDMGDNSQAGCPQGVPGPRSQAGANYAALRTQEASAPLQANGPKRQPHRRKLSGQAQNCPQSWPETGPKI